jgi:hypothetical protein
MAAVYHNYNFAGLQVAFFIGYPSHKSAQTFVHVLKVYVGFESFQAQHELLYRPVPPAVADVEIDLECSFIRADDFAYHVSEEANGDLSRRRPESLRFLLLELQCPLDFGCSVSIHENMLRVREHLPVGRILLPSPHRCVTVTYLSRLSLALLYGRQGWNRFCSTHTTRTSTLRPPYELPCATWFLN